MAIKLMKHYGTDEEADDIRLEVQILDRLVHEKIVRQYEFGESDGNYYLVMEEVNGPSFSNRWRNLHLEVRPWICGQVAEALHYAHLQGVIHRDVKGGNVLLTPNDEAKLADFGISYVTGSRKAPERDGPGQPFLHEPGAGPRQVARPSHRPVFPGCDAVRMHNRPCSVRRPGDVRAQPARKLPSLPRPPQEFRDLVNFGNLDPFTPGEESQACKRPS